MLDEVPSKLAPGIPLAQAILEAASSRNARYVYQYSGDDVVGWYVGDCIPPVDSYFRVSAGRITVETRDRNEAYFGRVIDGKIVQEGSPDNLKPIG